MTNLDLDHDSRKRYSDALATVKRLRKQWRLLGYPILSEGGSTGSVNVPHPLIRMIADAEAQAHRFGEALKGKKRPGPDPVAVRKPVDLSPAQKLRQVG